MPFNQETADRLCERIATSTSSLKTICKDEGMPSVGVILKWLSQNEAFEGQYARAKQAQVEALMDETVDIADDGRNDYMERLNFEGSVPGWHLNGEALARSRLRIDTRKWLASKLKPKKYGEKLELDQTISASDPLLELLGKVATTGARLGRKPDDSDDQS